MAPPIKTKPHPRPPILLEPVPEGTGTKPAPVPGVSAALNDSFSLGLPMGPDMWGQDVFNSRRYWGASRIIIPGASFGTVPIAGAPILPPKAPFDTMKFLAELANEIESLDIDFHNVPVNRQSGLRRFSEFTPRAIRPAKPDIRIAKNVKARVVGEIRPVQGKDFSIINRFFVEYTPTVVKLNPQAYLPNLEIHGFAGVDSPELTYDRSFKKRKSVLTMKKGDFNYENPLGKGTPYHTTFGSKVAPPPSGHYDWMIRFSPVISNGMAWVMEASADSVIDITAGRAGLMLWPFLPTLGLYQDKPYRDLKIRYNTFPRRLGDLISLFLYLRGDKGKKLREKAPFINPNTEYIDRYGKRKFIPEDRAKVIALNKVRKKLGLPELGANRGTIVDWLFKDLINDPKRLAKLPTKDLPYGDFHLRFRKTELKTPIGTIELNPKTDIKARYYTWRTWDKGRKKLIDRGLGLRIHAKPLSLGKINLSMGGIKLRAQELVADHTIIEIPSLRSIPGMDSIKGGPKGPDRPIKITLKGVRTKGLVLEDSGKTFSIDLGNAELGELTLTKEGNKLSFGINGIKANGINIISQFGDLNIKKAELPFDKKKRKSNMLSATMEFDSKEKPKFVEVNLPLLKSFGGLTLKSQSDGDKKGLPIPLKTEGSSTLKNIFFRNKIGSTHSNIETGFEFEGAIESARTEFEPLGGIQFSTVEKKGDKTIRHSVKGSVRADIKTPNDPKAPKPAPNFKINLKLPYVGFETNGRLKIPSGKAALRNAEVTIKPGSIEAEGDVNLLDGVLKGFGDHETQLGRILFPKDTPIMENLRLSGRAKFKLDKSGWKLSRPDEKKKLGLSLSIRDSKISYKHDLLKSFVGHVPASKIIETWAKIDKAQVELENFQVIERKKRPDGKGGVFTKFITGPFTVHHVEGKGTLWAPLPIWSYVRGLFPNIGKTKKVISSKRPKIDPLVAHLPKEVRKKLGSGDFFRLEGIHYQLRADQTWEAKIDDLILNVHEAGGRDQFGLIRIPEITFKGDKNSSTGDFGKGNFLFNILLNDPDRGGYFRFYRWPKKP